MRESLLREALEECLFAGPVTARYANFELAQANRFMLPRVTHLLRASEPMIAVIFESKPHDDQRDAYLEAAASLKPLLAGIDGFISVERFQSLTEPGKILSLSFWRDEEAVARWRQVEAHRTVQGAGRTRIFADYRLRVAHVVRDYGLRERGEAPSDSRARHGA